MRKTTLKEMSGLKFGRLTVLWRSDKNDVGGKPQWVCRCNCGAIAIVSGWCLRRGRTKSCGCWRREYGAIQCRGRFSATPEMIAARKRKSREGNLRRHILHKYGLSWEEYQQMLEAQEGVCEICGERPNETLHVDHNHATGAVRDLLCKNCNQMLGFSKERAHVLRAAADYLEKHNGEL